MITAVDAHAAGEPGRVIVGGVLDVPGRTMFEKKTYLEQHGDDLRKRMLREPRGYPGLCCNLVLPPTRPEADAGFVVMEQTEYPPMSGSNLICVATVLLETGYRGRDDRPVLGPCNPPGCRAQERRRHFDRRARLGTAGILDGCPRSLPVRDRHLRQDGHAARARQTPAPHGLPP